MRATWLRLRNLFRGKLDRDIDEELGFHIDAAVEDYIANGLSPDEARRRARQDFGNRTAVQESGRETFTFARLETLVQDIRYGLRVLRKNPGFALAAILTLALGIGVNVAIFSLVYGVLLRPLPYESGDRLVVLHQRASRLNLPDVPFSVHEILDYRAQTSSFDGIVEHHSMNFLLLDGEGAERVNTAVVSANFFDVLGVEPLFGRTFVEEDEATGANAVLVLSYEYWIARHGGNPDIVGKVFEMNNRPHKVIGVLPPIPQYPMENDVYMPTSQCPTRSSAAFIGNRTSRMMTAFARLKPGVELAQAQADLSRVASNLEASYPEVYRPEYGYTMAAAPLREDLTRRARLTFFVLLGSAGFVLLIACANVANLLLARLLKLERELALRAALGAGKLRLVRQLLTESMLLSLAGGLLGLALAPAALRLLAQFAERFTTRAAEVRIDQPVLFFALGVSLAAGLLFGLWPAFASSKPLADGLKQSSAQGGTSRSGMRLRSALVVAQLAISFVLLIGAGLMIRSFLQMQRVDPGFSPERLLTMRLSPNFTRIARPDQYLNLSEGVLREVKSVSGVESVAMTGNFPFNPLSAAITPNNTAIQVQGEPVPAGQAAPMVHRVSISPDYFSAIRQPLAAGRMFTDFDDAAAPPVAIVNQTTARHRWPGESPIGKRIAFGTGQQWMEIVGVVGDTRDYGLTQPSADEVYVPIKQGANFAPMLVVRTMSDPTALASAVRAALRRVDAQLAVDRIATIDSLREESIASPRVTTILLGLFALLALLISASGIAAVMALAVSQRTNELGIRMALGASRAGIVGMVVRQGLALAIAGTLLGVAGALALTRLMSNLLFSTSPTDVLTFTAIAAVFLIVATIACLIPARQITAIDPLRALRQD